MAATLLGRNKRTVQRWCEDGTLKVVDCEPIKGQRLAVDLAQVLYLFGPHAEPDFAGLIVAADRGDAAAQTNLGLVLLQEGKADAAITLFESAAQQDDPEAMHWLYRCYKDGLGVGRDENLAMMWLHKAAAHGHAIAQAQTHALRTLALQQLQAGAESRPG